MMKRWVISLLFAYPMWANAQSVEEYRQAMDAFDSMNSISWLSMSWMPLIMKCQ